MAWPAWALDGWARVQPYVDRLAVWRGYEQELQTLAIYGVGIAIYTALVFAFYQNLSQRRPFHFRLSDKPHWTGRTFRFIERALVFPVTSFLYFAFLALALFVLAKSQSTQGILLVAMAVIVGIRVTVYLSEQMSNDLAKLVPLSLMAVLLVDPGYLTLELAWSRVLEATQLWPLLGRYFLLFIVLEAVMSSARLGIVKIGSRIRGWRDARKEPTTMFSVDVQEPNPPNAPRPKAP